MSLPHKTCDKITAGIFGCSGYSLTEQEITFFTHLNPLGFILFARNIDTPDQVKALTESLRAITGRPNTPILIDQEGGRVQRMKEPHWQSYPPAKSFGDMYVQQSPEKACQSNFENAAKIGMDLRAVGVNVDCLPLLDIPVAGAHDVIGDRAFSDDITIVAELGAIQADGLLSVGVLPVIKHIPGHGRALVDSHLDLPRVTETLQNLENTDFKPFVINKKYPLAMTAHIIYTAIDADTVLTHSKNGINYIRTVMGYTGLLMTDDLSMKALPGTFAEKTTSCIDAGCDVILHCNGDMAEMTEIASVLPEMTQNAYDRWDIAERLLPQG